MTLSYTMSLMPPYILNDLRLKDFGYKINPLGMGYTPHPDGRSLIEGEDAALVSTRSRTTRRRTPRRWGPTTSGSGGSRTSCTRS